jgi:O-acetyl-ADP-ribose deacetylase (regulator of RNase III)
MGNYSIRKGDLCQATEQVIAHQVNCLGVMGAGVAKQIKTNWPIVFEQYSNLCDKYVADSSKLLGKCTMTAIHLGGTLDDRKHFKWVANLFGQDHHDSSRRQTNYEALYCALDSLYLAMLDYGLTSVAFPYKLASGLAGGNWPIVETMIKEIFGADRDNGIDVTIYEFVK